MPAKTDFNVAPYWDDFAITNDFYRVLFRPGFAVQARELTTLQTILQNQIEQFGNHFFKEGTIVIPGSVGYDPNYYAVKIQSTYDSNTVADYLSQYNGSVITGATSGVTAEVIGYSVADSTTGDPDTLFVKYVSSSTVDNTTTVFTDDELISANKIINSIAVDTASSQLQATSATATGSAAAITEGIFFVRGFMCRTETQTIVLDKYTDTPSYRIGFTITESIITPEDDSLLLDNAAGSTNYAAKGAYRFKITLILGKKSLTDTDDANFVELARVNSGTIVHRKKATEYTIVADMIARRTDDESGDYVVKHFDIEPRESLSDGTNRGIYTAAQGGLETQDVLVIAPGKAYVNGYEVDLQNTSYVSFDKARTTKSVNNDNVPFNLGNYAKVNNVYSQPDVSKVGSSLDPFDFVKLYDAQITTPGAFSTNGTFIGLARSRAFEYSSGTVGALAAIYHNYLFDISMFTKIVMTQNVTTLTANAQVTGSVSGATGYVVAAISGATDVYLMQVEGAFAANDVLQSSLSTDDTSTTTPLISTVTTYDFGQHVKSIFQDTTPIDYSSDVELDQSFTLTGEVTTTGASATVTGTSTVFTTELNVEDVIQLPTGSAGATEEFRVSAIASNLSMTIAKTGIAANPATATTTTTSVKATRIRAKIAEEEEVVLVYKTPKERTKTLLDSNGDSDTTYSFRQQFVGTTNASSKVTFSANAGETFDSTTAGRDYTLTVTATGSGSLANGAILDLSGTKAASTTISATGAQTLDITDATLLGTSAGVTLTATISVGAKGQAAKTANKMTQKTIASNKGTPNGSAGTGTYTEIYGERVDDKSISLSYADTYTLHAVFESTAIGTTPVAPTLTIASSTGTFTVGEIITGSSSAATGRVIVNSPSTTIQYVAISGIFTTNDNITGTDSAYWANVTATTLGDRVVTSNFLLDTGQRDSYYDLSRVVRKPDAVTPVGQLLIVYDYFGHGTGDYFSVDSYTGQVSYKDIPQYLVSKVDPESKAPKGAYELRDSLDFRPAVQTQSAPAASPFAFQTKNFEGTGSAAGNLVRPDDNVRIDFSFYLGRLDLLYLDQNGNFITVQGVPAEIPRFPATDDVNMLLCKYTVAPYTIDPENEVLVSYDYKRRYTMGDIGKLEYRIGKLEYATALGLLERETDSFQVLDADGLDRFKSGFIVDNFYGHNIGNPEEPDYGCSVDPGKGHLRAKSKLGMSNLIEENTTDTQRTANYYQKTGDIITLPYTHVADLTQPYASRTESVNPFSVTLWVGKLQLTPDTDFWMDEDRVPSVSIDVEGNYEQMLRELGGEGQLGTIWNAWNTTWTGNRSSSSSSGMETNPNGSGEAGNLIRRNTSWSSSVDVRQRRTGTNTRLVERIDRVSQGDRVVSIDVVPWMRSRDVNFQLNGGKPNTRMYAFFDRVDVNSNVKPIGTNAANTTLSQALTKIDTTVTVTSTTGFPTTGTIGVGDTLVSDPFGMTFRQQEQMTYTGTTSTTFTGITRNTGNQFTEAQEWASAQAVTNQTYGTVMITDGVGDLAGRFKIPNTEAKRFRVGTRTFRLTDSASDSQIPGTVDSSAEDLYTASGFKQTKQEIIFNVRNADVTQVALVAERQFTQTASGGSVGAWYDPLAQSIMCDHQSGMFLTKVDVFFYSKDDTLPVWCELRAMKDGYPSRTIFPFSKIVKKPADINVDETGTLGTVTTFEFESPIYVSNRQEVAFVLASNSPNYKVWISRLGDVEIGGTRAISTQPTLGSLFKSQNASTWSASQYEDLKFTAYRANFDIANTGTFVMVNEEMKAEDDLVTPVLLGGGKTSGIPTLKADPIDTSSGVTSLTVDTGGAGYTSVPTVSFSGGGGTGAAASATVVGGAVTALTLTNPGIGYATAPTIAFTTSGSSSAATATAVISSTSVRVRFPNHAMYSTTNNVKITGVQSEVGGSALNGAMTSATTGTVNVDDSSNWPGIGYVKIDDEIIYYTSKPNTTSISIPASGGRAYDSTTAAAHEDNSLVKLYMIGVNASVVGREGIPLTEVNKTHTSISGIELDSFLITTTTAAGMTLSGGGIAVQCSRNLPMDVMQPIIQTMELPNTSVAGKLQATTGTSVNGSETSFALTTSSAAIDIPLNEDYYFEAPHIVCSQINETNELAGDKSLRITASMTSTDATVSPIIDTARLGVVTVGNRLNEIVTSANIGALTPYSASTDATGDNNKAIYITKKIVLDRSATAIQVLFDAVQMAPANIKVLFKTLRVDSAENFDDVPWTYFNTLGAPDKTVPASKAMDDFKEYSYFIGQNSLGVGTELAEYTSFAIKIVMQGTNSSLPPVIKDFRAIAFQA